MINKLWIGSQTPQYGTQLNTFSEAFVKAPKKSSSSQALVSISIPVSTKAQSTVVANKWSELPKTTSSQQSLKASIQPSVPKIEAQLQVDFLDMMKDQVKLASEINLSNLAKEVEFYTISLLHPPTRKTIVFDLDETLIYNDGHEFKIRPYTDKMLEELSLLYDIWVWSASSSKYATFVTNLIDPYHMFITQVLDESYCCRESSKLVKDFRIFCNIDIENIVLVDNYLFSFAGNINNGILVMPYIGNEEDNELPELLVLLVHLLNYPSLRDALMECINLKSYFI